jgi:hypothetical protein
MTDGPPTYRINCSWHDDILEIVVTGQADRSNADEIAVKVIRLTESYKPRKRLIDVTNLQGRLDIDEAYYQDLLHDRHVVPTAVVLDLEKQRQHYTFLETAMSNKGYVLRFFSDRDEALAWLST